MSESQFRRYTKLLYLLKMLSEGKLALRSPSSWEDKNDSYYLELYKTKVRLKSLLVLCFAEAPETYIHWKIYAGGNDGVCIGFDKHRVLNRIKGDQNFIHDYVAYRTLKNLRHKNPAIDDLPFVKRYAYFGEQEYRILYKSPNKATNIKYLPITYQDVNFIEINPWIKKVEADSITRQIQEIKGFEHIRIRRSTITANSGWRRFAEDALENNRQHRRYKLSEEFRNGE